MQTLLLVAAAALAVAVAAYAQYRTPFHTKHRSDAWWARAMLLLVGLAFGYVLATVYTRSDGLGQVLVFLAGFGMVHLPAAFILFSKRRRGVTR